MTPEQEAMVMQLFAAGMAPQVPLEFSASKGFLPPDLGNMSSYTNVVQDWSNPVLASLIMASANMDAPEQTPQGRAKLQAIMENSGRNSFEYLLAEGILSGQSPSEAASNAEALLTESIEGKPPLLSFASDEERKAWRDTVTARANEYFNWNIEDAVTRTDTQKFSDLIGLPEAGGWQLSDFDPQIEDLARQREETLANALSMMKDDRMAALDERMGDTEAYKANALQSYLDSLAQPLATDPQPVEPSNYEVLGSRAPSTSQPSGSKRQATEVVEGITYMAPDGKIYFYDEPLTEAQMTTATLGVGFDAEDPYFQEAAKRIREGTGGTNQNGGRLQRAVDSGLDKVFESETNRDLAKARNNAAGMDYDLSGDTQDAVTAARDARTAVTDSARFAYTLGKFLESRGITPRSARANAFLNAGQRLFGS